MWVQLREALTVTALVLAMVLSAVIGVRQRLGTLTLALISFAWLTVDAKWEGGILVDLGHSHGLTAADLVGLPGWPWPAGSSGAITADRPRARPMTTSRRSTIPPGRAVSGRSSVGSRARVTPQPVAGDRCSPEARSGSPGARYW